VRFVQWLDLSVPLPLDFCFVTQQVNPALERFVQLLA